MPISRKLLLFLAWLAFPWAAAAAELTSTNVETWLDGIIPYALERSNIAGSLVVVVKDNQILLQKGYGYADMAAHRSIDPDQTLFRLGSISKLFTWTAVMQLVEQQRLDLDTDINTYLDFKIPPYQGRPITLRNLMTHTAGFEEAGKKLIAYDARDALTLDAYIHSATPARIFPPGEITAYSNYGAALAGYIVQLGSGQDFNTYIEQHIFAPLQMQHASFRQPLPPDLAPLLSSGYRAASDPTQPYEFVNAAPAGSAAMSGSDIARFMIEHLRAESGTGKGILRPDTAREMHATPFTTVSPYLHRMMLGFFELDRNGHRVIGHGGDTGWFHSNLYLWPDDGVGLFMVVNSQGRGAGVSVLRTLLFEQFADRYVPGPVMEGTVDPATARQHGALIAGQYSLSRRTETSFLSLENLLGQVNVDVDDTGQLSVPGLAVLTDQVRKFREVAPFVWREVNGANRIAAKVVDGKVRVLSEDEISPGMLLLPPTPLQDARWLLPLFLSSLAVLALTGITWAGGAVLRKYYGVSRVTSPHWVRTAAVAELLLTLCWLFTVSEVGSRTHFTALVIDPWLIFLHILSWVVYPATAALAAWQLVRNCQSRAGWGASVWSLCLTISCLTLLWVAVSFHLIGASLRF